MTRLRLMRFERGLTQTEVAATVGISREWLSMLELGKSSPSAPAAKALADFYGVTVAFLLGVEAEPEPKAAA